MDTYFVVCTGGVRHLGLHYHLFNSGSLVHNTTHTHIRTH